ncbi:hypothetical protein R6L23_06355 [Streptomyces sp. SR27]|uniref:hypothetical protein n=1 Tax=unclassified Streptomyces TaxID=2593676 RepID=UPI00295A6861|nr:hypothetical protein [Streptomyces sp. SR27]MDV9187837.1 hypothetical protein [Streptomyces sp. SR27]
MHSQPAAGAFVADVGNGTTRLGRVSRSQVGCVYLRPPGGGAEWAASPEDLRAPTEGEWSTIRVLTTPVPATLVLSADHGLRPRPEPAPDCTPCAHLVRWFDLYMGTGPQHDESAAVDCVVEIRNHPHDPPKMRIEAP